MTKMLGKKLLSGFCLERLSYCCYFFLDHVFHCFWFFTTLVATGVVVVCFEAPGCASRLIGCSLWFLGSWRGVPGFRLFSKLVGSPLLRFVWFLFCFCWVLLFFVLFVCFFACFGLFWWAFSLDCVLDHFQRFWGYRRVDGLARLLAIFLFAAVEGV